MIESEEKTEGHKEGRGAQGERKGMGKGRSQTKGRKGWGSGGGSGNASKKRPRQLERRGEPLTKGTPSDHRKSPSMVLSLSPIHWYSRYRSGEEPQGRRGAVSSAANRGRPFPGIELSV